MNKYQKSYLLAWAIVVITFIAAALLVPQQIGIWNKSESSFWVSFIMILVLFAGQLACSFFVLRKGNGQQKFLRLPIIYISYVALIVMLLVEIRCTVLPASQNWVGGILGLVILAFYGVAVLSTATATGMIQETEQKIKTETSFMRSLSVDAELLQKRAGTLMLAEITKKVYEAIRYSDPRSNQALAELESRLSADFVEFSEAVKEGDENLGKEKAESFLLLLEERNSKCRMLK